MRSQDFQACVKAMASIGVNLSELMCPRTSPRSGVRAYRPLGAKEPKPPAPIPVRDVRPMFRVFSMWLSMVLAVACGGLVFAYSTLQDDRALLLERLDALEDRIELQIDDQNHVLRFRYLEWDVANAVRSIDYLDTRIEDMSKDTEALLDEQERRR